MFRNIKLTSTNTLQFVLFISSLSISNTLHSSLGSGISSSDVVVVLMKEPGVVTLAALVVVVVVVGQMLEQVLMIIL